jgi:hypothetical protein
MDVSCAADESVTLRTAKSCGPDAPTLASSSREAKLLEGEGGNKARSPGRARRKPLKPSRAGMPGDSGATVVTNARVYYPPRAAAGASGTRHSPLPSWGSATPFVGRKVHAQLGRCARRGNANVCLRAPDAAQRAALAAWCAADPGPTLQASGSRLCGAS